MIYGIGSDIQDIARIVSICKKFKNRFINRILNELEIEEFKSRNECKYYLAKRFSAKESFAKALKTGIGEKCSFKDLSIINGGSGEPIVLLSKKMYDQMKELLPDRYSNWNIHVSISDTDNYAQSFIIIEFV